MTTIKEFYTPMCGQCPQQEEILEDVVADHDNVDLETVDATDQTDEANQYSVQSVPTTVILDDDGTVVQQFVGLTQADKIESFL